MTDKPSQIHETVQQYYSQQAKNQTACCASDSCCDNNLYSPDLLQNLPQDVTSFSLGCGDPITLAGLQPGDTVLDLGSGGGLDCFLAAKQVGETGHVIGVDMTPAMLERARASALKLGANNVEFRQGFLEALPVEDNSIDVVISNCVINLSPDKHQVFREVYRVLKPGSRIAVSDIVLSSDLPEDVRQDTLAWSACISGAIKAEEYAQGLVQAGFVEVQVQPKGAFEEAASLIPVGTPFSALISAKKPSL